MLLGFTSSLFVFRNDYAFNQGLSYVSIGSTEITYFTKVLMTSTSNKVTLIDFMTNMSTVLTEAVTLRSNRIKSPGHGNPKNTPASNYYIDEWLSRGIFVNNCSSIYKNFTVSGKYTAVVGVFAKQNNDYVFGYNDNKGYLLSYYKNGVVDHHR